MSRENVHPEILDGLEYESQFIQNTSSSQRRDVKLGRGDSWLLRYLPAQLGPNKRFYARVAKHWLNMKAVVCPRYTEEAFGGDPNAYCPVCDLSEHLNADRNEDVSKFGFKLRGSPNWITYCAVFQKAVNGGNPQEMSLPEVLQPYQHQHFKNSWEELTAFIRAGTRRSQLSVLDWEKGNDFNVSKTAKGLRLDKEDSAPIFDLQDPKFDENIQKLLAACKDPVVKMPTEKQQDDFAAKAEEEAENLSRGGAARTGGRRAAAAPRGPDEDDIPPEDQGQEAAPSRRAAPAQEAPPARRAPAPQAEPVRRAAPAPAPAPAPVRRAAPPAAAPTPVPARRAVLAPAPEPEPENQEGDLPPEDQGQGDPGQEGDLPPEDQQVESAPEPAPAPRPRPTGTPRTAPVARAEAPPAPARRAAEAPAAPARTAAPRGGQVAAESLDPDENIPEERGDAAPPAPLIDPAEDGVDGGASEAPPAVEPARRGQFTSSMRGKIAAANASTKK